MSVTETVAVLSSGDFSGRGRSGEFYEAVYSARR